VDPEGSLMSAPSRDDYADCPRSYLTGTHDLFINDDDDIECHNCDCLWVKGY
jgi:hypothetical protein